jgi:hypothetical protein
VKAQAAKQADKAVRKTPAAPAYTTTPVAAGPMLLQRKPCACGGDCPRCKNKLPLQAKLSVSEPGDRLEREADDVAEQVLRMQPGTPTDTTIEARAGPRISRVASHSSSNYSHDVPSAVHDTLRSPGQPLDSATRGFFEPRFGRDLSDVRVHVGGQPAQSAQSVGALAYTVGRNVVFGAGQYAPHSDTGRRLLAHELTHVVQQSGEGAAHQLQRKPGKCPPFPAPGFTATVTFAGSSVPTSDKGDASFSIMTDGTDALELSYHSTAGENPKEDPPPEFFGGLHWNVRGAGTLVADPTNGTGTWTRPTTPSDIVLTLRTVAQDCLMARVTIHVIAPIIIKNPKATKPKDEPQKGPVCGPDISQPLADVLKDVRSTFGGWSDQERRNACLQMITVPVAINAWDIEDLYLPETGWLRMNPFFPACGKPGPADDSQGIEDANLCSNSVEVGGKCFLAGTVNYVMFGQMFRLCSDAGQPLDLAHPRRLDKSGMFRFIQMYKLDGLFDDYKPPSAWAEAGFDGYPGHVPDGSNENRANCTGRCTVPYQPRHAFTWVWEPVHERGPM